MSRSGYNEDCDNDWQLIMWRGAVASAIRGKRGQAFLKEMLASLDLLPDQRLISHDLEIEDGSVCAIGAVGKSRGVDMKDIDPENYSAIAGVFGISEALAREIMFMNDDYETETPEKRYQGMHKWIERHIRGEQ